MRPLRFLGLVALMLAVAGSRPASGQEAHAQGPPLTACSLLTREDVQALAGWPVAQVSPVHNPGPPPLSICTFMGKDLTRSITVWYGGGSGGRYKTSAEMASAIGNRDGMLTGPAQPLDGLGIPATREDQQGLVHVHGINSMGDELTVAAPTYQSARALFIKALARMPRP